MLKKNNTKTKKNSCFPCLKKKIKMKPTELNKVIILDTKKNNLLMQLEQKKYNKSKPKEENNLNVLMQNDLLTKDWCPNRNVIFSPIPSREHSNPSINSLIK